MYIRTPAVTYMTSWIAAGMTGRTIEIPWSEIAIERAIMVGFTKAPRYSKRQGPSSLRMKTT
jgi:hypothetical protein